jgi:hypothetical protein
MAVNVGMESAITIPGHLFCLMHHNPPFRVSIECDLLQANNTNNKPRPESPRWLVHEGFYEEARTVVAQTNADGDPSNPIVLTVYKEILDTLEWEKKERHVRGAVFLRGGKHHRFLLSWVGAQHSWNHQLERPVKSGACSIS